MVAYVASRSPLPLIPFRENAPAFNVTELTEHERPVLNHLPLPHVRQAGSHTSCGCGFNEGREHPEVHDDPAADRGDRANVRPSSTRTKRMTPLPSGVLSGPAASPRA